MAEFTNLTDQTLAPNQATAFTLNPVPCERGFVRWRQGGSSFNLSGRVFNRGCCCRRPRSAMYQVTVKANIAVAEGETPGPISMVLALNGTPIPESIMTVTPAVVGDFFNIGCAVSVPVWAGCCEDLSLINASDISIDMNTPVVNITRPDLLVTY